jgi:hypothetical protein
MAYNSFDKNRFGFGFVFKILYPFNQYKLLDNNQNDHDQNAMLMINLVFKSVLQLINY